MNLFIDEEDGESKDEKAARERERAYLRRLASGDGKNPDEKPSWDIIATSKALYQLFASTGIVHATPKQLKLHEKRGIGITIIVKK